MNIIIVVVVLDSQEIIQKTYYRQILHSVDMEQDFNNMVNLTIMHLDGMRTELIDYWS